MHQKNQNKGGLAVSDQQQGGLAYQVKHSMDLLCQGSKTGPHFRLHCTGSGPTGQAWTQRI